MVLNNRRDAQYPALLINEIKRNGAAYTDQYQNPLDINNVMKCFRH